MPHLSALTRFSKGRNTVVLVVAGVGVIGMAALTLSHAATSSTSKEAESGTVSSAAGVITDTSASGSQAVKFGAGGDQSTTCDLNATTTNFSAQVSAATAGQTLCLASGTYSFSGTNKAITITKQSGATVNLDYFSFGNGDSDFTLDGLRIPGGDITAGANHITIKNSVITAQIHMATTGTNAAIVIDHNDVGNFITDPTVCAETPAMLQVSSSTGPGDVTISNNVIHDTNLDGVRVDSSSGATVINNEFYNVTEDGANDCHHTDSIQFYGGENVIVHGNYFHDNQDGIVAFDGTANNQITNNVCANIDRGSCVSFYSDQNSLVEHNTAGPGMTELELDHKTADPAGSGTIFRNNVGDVSAANGSTMSVNTHNLFSGASSPNISGSPVFAGGTSPTAWAGYKLASGSPGVGAATDGTNVGIN